MLDRSLCKHVRFMGHTGAGVIFFLLGIKCPFSWAKVHTNIVSCVCLFIEFATPSRLLMFKCYQWQAVRKDDYK